MIRASNFIDLTGLTFGRLTVMELVEAGSKPTWQCKCLCGAITFVKGDKLRGGRTISCGCYRRETSKHRGKLNTRHGMKNTGAWKSWSSMMGRHRSSSGRYANIFVCERWHTFENFYEDMGDRLPGMSIDRYPDKLGGYEPGNCRWATRKQQANNRRDNKP